MNKDYCLKCSFPIMIEELLTSGSKPLLDETENIRMWDQTDVLQELIYKAR